MSSVIKKKNTEKAGNDTADMDTYLDGAMLARLVGTAFGTGVGTGSWHCELAPWAMSDDRAKKFATSHFRACLIFLVRQHVVAVAVAVAVVLAVVAGVLLLLLSLYLCLYLYLR